MSAVKHKSILDCKLAQLEIYYCQPQILLLLGKKHKSTKHNSAMTDSNSYKEVLVPQNHGRSSTDFQRVKRLLFSLILSLLRSSQETLK